MPELPEVETIVRTLAPQVSGRHITAVTILLPKCVQAGQSLLPMLVGARILRVFRRAKLLLMEVGASSEGTRLVLAFHLKMTGSFFVHPRGTPPLKHTRLVFDLDDGGRLFFDDTRTFGYCRVMRQEELNDWIFWKELGPEPLDRPAADLARHFSSAFTGRRAAVKALLLDQAIVAGIGNIYADESLFRAGLRPDRSASSLGLADIERLAVSLQDILNLSITECGSSIRDYRDAHGNAGAFQNSFAVYGRKDESCSSCGSSLVSCRIAGRGTVFCPECQK